MIKERWQDLITQNPMLIEIRRFRRRYFSFSGANSVNSVVLGLILICYATLVLLVTENRSSIPPIILIQFETGMFTVFAPMMLYTSIAGERERRSWDLLLAAPITKSQIVVGKFIGAMAALGVGALMFEVPVAISAFSYDGAHWQTVLSANLVSFTFLMCVCALTILFSARVKRGLMALGATLGILVTSLIIVPSLLGFGNPDTHQLTDVTFYLHPFYAMNRIGSFDTRFDEFSPGPSSGVPTMAMPGHYAFVYSFWWGIPQALIYFAFAGCLLTWASQTLNFAENEVKFLPQGQKDA